MENEFLKELRALLEKHNASIGWTCSPCSDTHGINGDCIYIKANGKEMYRTEEGCGYLSAHVMREDGAGN